MSHDRKGSGSIVNLPKYSTELIINIYILLVSIFAVAFQEHY